MAHQRPDSGDSFENNSERDYENVIPSHLLRWQQQAPQPKVKPKPDIFLPTHTDHKECCSPRASTIILYFLVCASLLIAAAALVLAIWNFLPRCQEDWQMFQTKCYYFSTNEELWETANNICWSLSSHLVVTNELDTNEHNFLVHGNTSRYWAGLKRDSKGEWKWVNGTSLSNITWVKGNGSCAYISWQSKAALETQSCEQPLRYICEKQPA